MSSVLVMVKGEPEPVSFDDATAVRVGHGVIEVVVKADGHTAVHGWPQGQVAWYEVRETS